MIGQRTELRLSAAVVIAMVLSSAAFVPIFEQGGWALPLLGTILAVVGAGMLARRARLARPLQPVAGLLALLAWTCLLFVRPTLSYAVLPSGGTLPALRGLFTAGWLDVERLAPPVPTNPGLLLLAVLGVGAVTVVVDLLAVVLRRGALAGVPLLLLLAVPSAVLPGGTGVVIFALAALGWLGLLVADSGERVARWGTSPQQAPADETVGRAGRRIGVAALGVALVVPALVPGMQSRFLGDGDGPGFGGARRTTTFNPLLRLSGQLQQDPKDLFSYTSEAGDPDYLRLTTLDLYDEKDGWSSSPLTGDITRDRLEDGIPDPVGVPADGVGPQAEVEVSLTDQLGGTWLPLPLSLTDVAGIDGPWLWDADADTAFSSRAPLSDVDRPYTATARTNQPDVETLRAEQDGVPDEIADTYARAPTLTDRVRRELNRITADSPTDYDRVVAIQAYFAKNDDFSYDEDAAEPDRSTPDALENFMTVSQQGYCEQYASAMGALVRGLGLPARVAVGFTAGTRTGADRYEVSTLDAHAWPEVFFSDVGWVRFEPTPRTDQVLLVPAYTEPATDAVEGGQAPAAPSPTAAAAPAPGAATVSPNLLEGEQGPTGGDGAGAGAGLRWITVPLVLLVVLLAPALLAVLRRRARVQHGDALALWAVLRDDARDLGHRFQPQDSPRAAADRLREGTALGPAAGRSLLALAAAAERARYGRPAVTAAPDQASLRADLAGVRSALRGDVGLAARLRARLVPASTIDWARAAVTRATRRAQDRFETVGATTSSRLAAAWPGRRS